MARSGVEHEQVSSHHSSTMGHSTLVPGSQFTHFAYNPNIAANALYVVLFSVCLIGQVIQGVRHRTWQFMGAMVIGILLEVAGYVSRIFLHKNPENRSWFLANNIVLILGPAFLAASMYLCMGHLISIYGAHLSSLKPRTYLYFFVACDLLNLVLQGTGGGISSMLLTPTGIQAGLNVVIAGLVTQVASLLLFMACCAHFAICVSRQSNKQLECFREVRQSKTFHSFLYGLAFAVMCIFTRSVFRTVELHEGFTGPLANNETYFMILEGAMILLATISLTIFHPGRCFKGCWQSALDSARTYNSMDAENPAQSELKDISTPDSGSSI